MRFLFVLAVIMMSVQAELNVLQLFLGKPAEGNDSALLELNAEKENDYEQMLNAIDTCDPELEAVCSVYGLVQLEDGNTAIVNLGFWDDLKKGFSGAVSKAKEGLSKAKDALSSVGSKAKNYFSGTKKVATPAETAAALQQLNFFEDEEFIY